MGSPKHCNAASLMLSGLGPSATAESLASLLGGALAEGLVSTKLNTKPSGDQFARLQYRTRELASRALHSISSSLSTREGYFPASWKVDRWSSKERRKQTGSRSSNAWMAGNAHSAAASGMDKWNTQLRRMFSMYPRAPPPPFGASARPPFPPPGPGPWANYNPWMFSS